MLDDIYLTTICLTIGITLIFCLLFFILSIPKTAYLHNYRRARYVMACAYLTLGLMNIAELFSHPEAVDIQSSKMIALLVCLFQSFLFTYTNITLIKIDFVTKKNIFWELFPIVVLCISAPVVLMVESLSAYANALFYVFIMYYISMLIRYTILFQKYYRRYVAKIDNFFAEQESERFRWISLSFYAALTLGLAALFVTLFFSTVIGIFFAIFIIGFYSYYGIQFINYAFLSQQVEAVITENEDEKIRYDKIVFVRNYSPLEQHINQWIACKGFLNHGINIEKVALQLNTNRAYLSDYVNIHRQTTFKEWISELRVNEAKELLLRHPDLSILEISEKAGFSDNSNFGRLFKQHTGMSPKAWRVSAMDIEQQSS